MWPNPSHFKTMLAAPLVAEGIWAASMLALMPAAIWSAGPALTLILAAEVCFSLVDALVWCLGFWFGHGWADAERFRVLARWSVLQGCLVSLLWLPAAAIFLSMLAWMQPWH